MSKTVFSHSALTIGLAACLHPMLFSWSCYSFPSRLFIILKLAYSEMLVFVQELSIKFDFIDQIVLWSGGYSVPLIDCLSQMYCVHM